MIKREVFVGRFSAIRKFNLFLDQIFNPKDVDQPQLLTVKGPGGIGKTHFLIKCSELAKQRGVYFTDVIDLKATVNRSKLSFLRSLAESITSQNGLEPLRFYNFYNALDRYNAAEAEEKPDREPDVEKFFISDLMDLSVNKPVVIFLDTWESIQVTNIIRDWIEKLISEITGRIGVVMAGRKTIKIREIPGVQLLLRGLSFTDAKKLMASLYQEQNKVFDLENEGALLKNIYSLTLGRPVRIALATDYILETGHPEELEAMTPKEFEEGVTKRLKEKLDEHENPTIMLMTIANRRFNNRILSLLKPEWEDFDEICQKISRFSFVKVREELDGSTALSLHDEMYDYVNKYWSYPASTKKNFRISLVQRYYDPQIQECKDPQLRQALAIEKLYYLISVDLEKGMGFFQEEMKSAINSYQFDFCSLLLSETDQFITS